MIEFIDVTKSFGKTWVAQGVNLTIPKRKMTCIIGRSGEGKSVLLKLMIGLLQPTSGHILIDGVDITALDRTEKEEMYKKFGYVFQSAALLDSLTVFENVALTLLEHGVSASDALSIVREKLALVNLDYDILHKYPSELSGGMRKRVGLARTLVTNPSIILYDEPTTGLDPITTRVVYGLMRDMQKKLNITSVVISHDLEIFKYVDNVALLYDGKIRYVGDAQSVWHTENPYIYQFIRGLEAGPIRPKVDAEHPR